jgi:hypothetical protein
MVQERSPVEEDGVQYVKAQGQLDFERSAASRRRNMNAT